MAFANANISDIVATTIQQRSRRIADNVTDNNALLTWMKKRGNSRTFGGGNVILEEISFAENPNAGYYSGYDLLPMAAADVISAAEFSIKQAAVPVIISGLEMLQNSGREQMIDLMEARIKVAESTMANLLANGIYSDGTGSGGKQITGLDAAVAVTPTTGTYGGIDRATWTFWRNKTTTAGSAWTSSTVQGAMNTMWASLNRGADRPDLIIMDNNEMAIYKYSTQYKKLETIPYSKPEDWFKQLNHFYKLFELPSIPTYYSNNDYLQDFYFTRFNYSYNLYLNYKNGFIYQAHYNYIKKINNHTTYANMKKEDVWLSDNLTPKSKILLVNDESKSVLYYDRFYNLIYENTTNNKTVVNAALAANSEPARFDYCTNIQQEKVFGISGFNKRSITISSWKL